LQALLEEAHEVAEQLRDERRQLRHARALVVVQRTWTDRHANPLLGAASAAGGAPVATAYAASRDDSQRRRDARSSRGRTARAPSQISDPGARRFAPG